MIRVLSLFFSSSCCLLFRHESSFLHALIGLCRKVPYLFTAQLFASFMLSFFLSPSALSPSLLTLSLILQSSWQSFILLRTVCNSLCVFLSLLLRFFPPFTPLLLAPHLLFHFVIYEATAALKFKAHQAFGH